MKNCLRCGLLLADNAVRCPQCYYEYKSDSTGTSVNQKDKTAFSVLNLNNQKIGVLFSKTCRVLDNNSEPLFSYSNGSLTNLKNGMVFSVNYDGTVVNKAGKSVGFIRDYALFLSAIKDSTASNRQTDSSRFFYQSNSTDFKRREQQSTNMHNDPGPLLRKASDLLNNKNDIHGALQVEEEAYRLFPNNTDVIYSYACMLDIKIYVEEKVVGTDYPLSYKDYCNKMLELCSKLKSQHFDQAKIKKIQDSAYYTLGKFYFFSQYKNYDMAISMFINTDFSRYPYAATAIAHIHVMDARKYEREFYIDAQRIKPTLNANNWEGPIQHASAYYILSLLYSRGAPQLSKDINYAYKCIQKCASLDPEMAKSEIGKYRKGLFGITYCG